MSTGTINSDSSKNNTSALSKTAESANKLKDNIQGSTLSKVKQIAEKTPLTQTNYPGNESRWSYINRCGFDPLIPPDPPDTCG